VSRTRESSETGRQRTTTDRSIALKAMQRMWTSKRAVSLHVALVVFVPGCVALTWWQAARALGGNTLSWVYTFEWPIFAAYATFMWWKLLHEEPASDPTPGRVPSERPGTAEPGPPPTPEDRVAGGPGPDANQNDEQDEELAAYNRYLAELNASGRQKRW